MISMPGPLTNHLFCLRDLFSLHHGMNWHSVPFLALEPHVPMETHSSFKVEPYCSAEYFPMSHPLTLSTVTRREGYLFPVILWDELLKFRGITWSVKRQCSGIRTQSYSTFYPILHMGPTDVPFLTILPCIGYGYGGPSLTSVLRAFLT